MFANYLIKQILNNIDVQIAIIIAVYYVILLLILWIVHINTKKYND